MANKRNYEKGKTLASLSKDSNHGIQTYW